MAPEQPASGTALEVRLLHDGDAAAVRGLFREVFGHDMSEALWQWKYRTRDGHAIGVFRNGELVCHYGGSGATILYKGKPATALQSVDLMVKPSARHMVRTQSPFFLGSARFLEEFIGYGKPYLLGYGFPSTSAMKLSERLGLFGPVGQMTEVAWHVAPKAMRASLLVGDIAVTPDNFADHSPALDYLWQQFSREMHDYILVRKDAAWLRERYLQHPGIEYAVTLVRNRLTRKALGIIVLKCEPERVLLMDVITPARNMALMLRVALRHTVLLERSRLVTWCNEAFRERFAFYNPASKPLPFIIPANTWTPGPAPAELHDRWWLLPGDTDYL